MELDRGRNYQTQFRVARAIFHIGFIVVALTQWRELQFFSHSFNGVTQFAVARTLFIAESTI